MTLFCSIRRFAPLRTLVLASFAFGCESVPGQQPPPPGYGSDSGGVSRTGSQPAPIVSEPAPTTRASYFAMPPQPVPASQGFGKDPFSVPVGGIPAGIASPQQGSEYRSGATASRAQSAPRDGQASAGVRSQLAAVPQTADGATNLPSPNPSAAVPSTPPAPALNTAPALPPAPVAVSPPLASQESAQPQPANGLTVASLEARKAELLETEGLSEELKAQITEQCVRAIERVKEAEQLAARTTALRNEATAVPQATEALQQLMTEPLASAELPSDLASRSSREIRAAYQTAHTNFETYRERLSSLHSEVESRTNRTRVLPELIAQARAKFEEANSQLATPPVADEPQALTAAKRLRSEAARLQRWREWECLQQETKTYAEAARVMTLKVDLADRDYKATQRQVAELAKLLAEREKQEANQQAVAARSAANKVHPAVREAAKINSALAEANSQLVAAMETARSDVVTTEAQREELSIRYADTRKRAEEAGFSQSIGIMLRSQQAELPDIERYRTRAAQRVQAQAELNFKLLEWENERRKLQPIDEVVDTHLATVREQLGLIEQVDVRGELMEVFAARLNLYAELSANARDQLGRLAALESAEIGLAKEINQHATFISEHVLWVRSTAPLSPSLISPLLTSIAELTKPQVWRGVWEDLRGDWRTHPLFALLAMPPIWLLAIRRRLLADLELTSQVAKKATNTGMAPTFRAVFLTLVLAIPVSALMALFGWRLITVATPGEISHALGNALLFTAGAFAALRFVLIGCRPNGLAEAHFDWSPEITSAIRRAMSLAKYTSVPAGFVCLFTGFTGDEFLISTVGRLALIAQTLAITTISFELFRESGAVGRMLQVEHKGSWYQHSYRLWSGVLIFAPLALGFISAIGFHYTATRLSTRIAATWTAIALILVVRALAMRWLLMVYRRLAFQRARDRRAALVQARQADAGEQPLENIPVTDNPLELRLSDVNEQSQRLIRIGVLVLGVGLLMLIYRDILPALGYFNRFQFWTNSVVPPTEQGELVRVTLVDLFWGAVWLSLTVISCRNLPGLLDISLFQRLPFDAGARYAASALTQYVLIVIGAAVCFRQIGIGWQSIQWLVAAMTVGLGFGLQEIFANFVSGIILLFERPVRVGDTVTIGNVSGTVTRIRIRATTVLDWDNKELIVPNRDFVTGNLVNWTLSNPNLRLVIQVGIAYGSDTRLATRLLQEIAAANPLVLTDPAPVVVFSAFGASSLDFELRVFAAGLLQMRILRHELHTAIDDAFREHKIEIAFPQQDVYVRSLPDSLMDRVAAAAVASNEARQDAAHAVPPPAETRSIRKHVA
jgi:potassium efflux system protein